MARPQRSRRGLSGIWSGVLVILILLLTSSFIFIALNYIDQATTTAINTVKRTGESCSITRSITGYWTYDPASNNVTINITNYYLESITIVSIGFIINNTGNIQHVVIDKYNASNYGIKLPITIPPGGKINITITLPGKPIITSIGIWGSGLATLVIPPGIELTGGQSVILPEATAFYISLKLLSNKSIFYTDMDVPPKGWNALAGDWEILKDSGYWGTGDNALRVRLRGGNDRAEYDWQKDLSGLNKFYFYTKLKFNRVDPNYNASVYLYSNNYVAYYIGFFLVIIYPIYNVTVSGNTLDIAIYLDVYIYWQSYLIWREIDFLESNPVPISISSNNWYSLVIEYDSQRGITARLYDSSTGSLIGTTTSELLIPGSTISNLGLLASGGKFDLYFDEILVSTRDIHNTTFVGSENVWEITLSKGGTIIGSSTAQGTFTNVTVIKDAVTAINGYSNVCVTLPSGSACITSDIPILGGNVYEIHVIRSGNVNERNIVSVSTSSR